MDPDNRRPIDFNMRVKYLNKIIQQEAREPRALTKQLLNCWEDGRLKLYVIYKSLNVRQSYPHVFQDGHYVPLQVTGPKRENVCAYARYNGKAWVAVVVPRFLTRLVCDGTFPLGRSVWETDRLLLPDEAPEEWFNTLTGESLKTSGAVKELALSDIFATFPLALLTDI